MKDARWPAALAFLAAGVLLIAFLFVTLLGGARIGLLYGGVAGFSALRSIVQWAGIAAAIGFFVASSIVAVAVAVRPASWAAKVAAVLPALLLLFLLAALLSNYLGVGALGIVGVLSILGPVTFATAWLALGAVLAVPAIAIAAATRLSPATRRAASMTLGFTSLASVVAAIAMVGAVIIVANNQPRFGNFGNRPAPQAQQGAQTGHAPGGGNLGSQGNLGAGTGQFGGGEGGFAEGAGRPGGEGGPGGAGGLAAARQQFLAGGALMVVAALVQVLSTLVSLARSRLTTAAAGAPLAVTGAAIAATGASTAWPDLGATAPAESAGSVLAVGRARASAPAAGHGAGAAVLAGAGVILVAFGAMQLVPVSRINPPVQAAVQWDSPQTQQLWQRACADCHSNQTQWPWYTSIAPSSWLIAAHVNSGRQSFNISQGGGRRGGGEAAQQIRNGSMPPQDYTLIHPTARLSDAEKQLLITGLQNSLGR